MLISDLIPPCHFAHPSQHAHNYHVLLLVVQCVIPCLFAASSGERRHMCPVCKRAFKDAYTMKHHHETQHLHKYRFHCDTCNRPFDKLSHKARHKCNPGLTESFHYRSGKPMEKCSTKLCDDAAMDKQKSKSGVVKNTSGVTKIKKESKAGVANKKSKSGVATKKSKPGVATPGVGKDKSIPGVVNKLSITSPVTPDTVAISGSDTCNVVTTQTKPQNCSSENSAGVKHSGVPGAQNEDLKDRFVRHERGGTTVVIIHSQPTPDKSGGRSDKTMDEEELCSRETVEDDVQPSRAPTGVNVEEHQQRMSLSVNKTPGRILVTYLPAATMTQQQLSDAASSSRATSDESGNEVLLQDTPTSNGVISVLLQETPSGNEVLLQETPSGSQEVREDAQSALSGCGDTLVDSEATLKRNETTLANENGATSGVIGVRSTSCTEAAVGNATEPASERRSMRQEQRRMLKTLKLQDL